ncbi:hypothetical protein M8J77_020015 [Diaphorina citri]|nr:hypothetical protein M8J77_020015 [Diaphorina citri]
MAALDDAHLPSSDDSDEDFVPSGEENLPSEDDSNDEVESDDNQTIDNEGVKKRSKQSKKSQKRRKIVTEEPSNKEEEKSDKPTLSTDELWKEFISGPTESPSDKKEESSSSMPEVKTVTQVCTFAGEQVKVEKQVPVSIVNSRGRGRGGRGGMAGILGALGKQPKLSILEKSKLDWTQYKQSEGLEEQLSTFNKGKDGYLEKQEFLQRTDLRQFENEKELRNATRKTLR